MHAILPLVLAILSTGLAAAGPARAQAPAPSPAAGSICLMLESAARAHDLPVAYLARLIWRESSFRTEAVGPQTRSGARAQGIAQFMPGTAAERGVLDPFDPIQALPKAAEFLRELRTEFGNLGLAAAAYNAGPRRLREWLDGTGSMPAETRSYVTAITGQSIEDWKAAGRQSDFREDQFSCDTMLAQVKRVPDTYLAALEERVNRDAGRPWNVQLSASFSRAAALMKYADQVKRFASVIADADPVISGAVLRSRGPRALYRVSVGAQNRVEANVVCNRIRKAGGACMVLRNGPERQNRTG